MSQRISTTWSELFGVPLEDTVAIDPRYFEAATVDKDEFAADLRNDFVDEVNEVLRLYGARLQGTGEIRGKEDSLIFVISEGVWDDLKARIRMIDVDAMIRAKL